MAGSIISLTPEASVNRRYGCILIFALTIIFAGCEKSKPVITRKSVETVGTPTAPTAPTATTTPTSTPLTRIFLGTITPLSYYPVYPGSWWVYKGFTAQGVITSTATATGYILDSIDINTKRRVAYVPKMGNTSIWGYDQHYCVTINPYTKTTICMIPVLSETLNHFWTTDYFHPQKVTTTDRVFVVDTSLTVLGTTYSPVIGVKSQVGMPSGPWLLSTKFYAKGVGLVMSINHLKSPADTVKLADHHINL